MYAYERVCDIMTTGTKEATLIKEVGPNEVWLCMGAPQKRKRKFLETRSSLVYSQVLCNEGHLMGQNAIVRVC